MVPERIGAYRIEGLLGRGGMGVVYRAFDEKLRRAVAIKEIRAAELTDPDVRERFWREARSAAEMRHPAIVRIYHMGEDRGRDYIVMELVEGRTLAATLADGPLEPHRAAALFRQLAEALAEAHGRGVIHRDLKAENVMVTPDGHAKVLDFGLAKRLGPETSLSASGTVVGTPATMSPEQIQGQEVDPRSDLFSLGAVLYQALAGKPPFRAETPSETFARICVFHPPPLSTLDPRIPRALSDLVVRLLQKSPEDRPQSAAEVAAELGRLADESGARAARASADDEPTLVRSLLPHRRRYAFAALGTVAVVSLAVAALQFLPGEARDDPAVASPAPPVAVRPAVAVLGLERQPPRLDDTWLATALSEMLAAELRAGDRIRVVGGGEVAAALHETAPGPLTGLDGESLARLGNVLGARLVVWGTFGDVDEKAPQLVRIDLRLQDASTGEILASNGSTGTSQELFGLVDRAAAAIRDKLGIGALTPAETLATEALLPRDAKAVRFYSEGLARLRQLDALMARDLFERAIAADPGHPMPYAALSEAWSVLGYDDEAREAAAKALELAGSLSETARRRIDARYHAAAQEWDEAVRIYGGLFAAVPDDVEVGLDLADAQIQAGEISAALVTLEALRRLPEPLTRDPRIDLAQARASYHQGDRRQMLVFAERAAEAGEALGAPRLVAEARLRQTTALQDLGEFPRAMSSLEEAKRLFDQVGDRQGSAKALELTASSIWEQKGDLPGARRLFEKARSTYLEIGNLKRAAGVQAMIGSILVTQGQLQEAVDALEQALATFQDLGAKREAAVVLNNLGFDYFMQGDWQAAITSYTEALTLFEALRDRNGVAAAYTNVAEILYIQGDLDQARKMHEEALTIKREILDQAGIAYDTFRLGKILAAKGDLFAARGKYQEALAVQSDLGKAAAAAETRMELAVVELADGKPQAAEALARQAEEVLRNEGWSDLAALSGSVLVRALLARGNLAEARETMARVEAVAAGSEDPRVRFETAIAAARVRAASPEAARAAIADLDEAAREAKAAGYVEENLEARLAAAEIGLVAGREDATRRLAAVEAEAKRRGFGQIARRAASLDGAGPPGSVP